jgi:glycosidase
MGVDAFRIDTMKHISRLTFNKYYFPGILEYAHRLGNDNFFTFGEVASRDENVWNHDVEPVSVPFYTWKESKTYNWGDKDTNFSSTEKHFGDHRGSRPTTNNAWLNGLNYHTPDHSMWNGNGMIDFQMHHAFRDVGNAFRAGRDNSKYFNDATYNVMYVDSHDYGPNTMEGVRFNLGSAEWAKRMNLMWTFRGIPCIYYGSEIEFQRGKPIDQWDAPLSTTGRAYFGDHLSGSVTTTGFGTYSASSGNMQTTLNHTLAKHLQKLNQIRLAVPALRRGQMNLDNASGNETAFIRRYTSGGIDSLACVSVGGGASFRGLPNGRYIDLVSGNVINVTGGSLSTGNISDTNLRVYVYDPSNSFTTAIGGSTTYLS